MPSMTFVPGPGARVGLNGDNAPRSPPKDPKLQILRGPEDLPAWIQQTESSAQLLGCANELHDGSTAPRRAVTIRDFLLMSRCDAALHIITSTVGSPIYAYARVLGYNSICGKNPTSLYSFVKMAATRIRLVHGGKQTAEEAAKILSEWQHARRDFYPPQVRFDGAIEWLEKMIRRRYACGDETMATAVEVMDKVAKEKGVHDRRKRGSPDADADADDDAVAESLRLTSKRRATDELRQIRANIKAEPESDPLEILTRGSPKQLVPPPKP